MAEKRYVSPFATAPRPTPNPTPKPGPDRPAESAGPTPGPDREKAPGTPGKPQPPGVKAKRYNLTVRLSGDEREDLEAIGKREGRPHPMTLAETVRWMIQKLK